MTKFYTHLLHIISCLVNNTDIDWTLFKDYSPKDWKLFYKFSKQQGVVAIIFDRLKEIPKDIAPPKDIVMKWFSHALSIEKQMRTKETVAIEFAEKFAERDIHIAVLKGIAYASYFPNPYHRESGDLDCYMMGKKELGDKIIVELGGKMEEAGYMHSHLYYKGLTIENHNLLTSADKSKISAKTESLLQEMIKDGCKPIAQTKLLNPSADFNAMFLIKHAQRHFIKEGICIRHLLDWAFFLKAEATNVNWQRVIPMMEECLILNFAKALTAICIEDLGMTINVKELQGECKISKSVLEDILGEQPDLFKENFIQKIGRILRRFYRMWKFRSLAYKSYIGLVWESFVVSSYLSKVFKL
jgi:hypothetical protein